MKRILAAAAACLMSTAAHAVDIYTVDGYPNALVARGEINRGDAEYLRTSLDTRAREGYPVNVIMLNSPGGIIGEAMRMTDLIRERGINTLVPSDGECSSACVLVLAGGVERYAWQGAHIGVHNASSIYGNNYGEHSESDGGTVGMAKWLAFYGAPASVIAKLVVTPSNDVTWLSDSDLAGWVQVLYPNNPTPQMQQHEPEQRNNSEYSMICRSTASGNFYNVYWSSNQVQVGERTYSVDEYHLNRGKVGGASTGRTAWVVSGTTHINTRYTAVFGGRRPRVEFYNGHTQATDLCNYR